MYRATEMGYEAIGVRRGWEGLTHLTVGLEEDSHYIRHLDRTNTRTIDRTGGTILHTSRTNPRKMPLAAMPAAIPRSRWPSLEAAEGIFDVTPVVLENLEALGIEVLVTIGGDDTLSYAQVLANLRSPARRYPQDHGQRRPGHRVLHRLLDRDHAGEGGHQPPADHARVARADRRVPDLRA